jgi:ABC-type uncharacterized transport system auxiliary subunit
MKTMKHAFVLLACAAMLLSTGCVKLWQKNLDIKTYMVEVRRDSQPVEKPLAEKLWIEDLHVLPPYNIRNLILRESEVEFTPSYYTELLMSPSENFRNGFYGWFSDSGIFEDVSVVNRVAMSHRLVATVMAFYGDTVENKAVLRIKVSFFDEKTNGVRVLFSKDYLQQVEIPVARADELIRAYNKAFTLILADCEKDVAAALK